VVECSAHQCRYAKPAIVITGNELPGRDVGVAVYTKVQVAVNWSEGEQLSQCTVLLAHSLELNGAERSAGSLAGSGIGAHGSGDRMSRSRPAGCPAEQHQLIRFGDGERLEQHGVNETEYGGARSDCHGQRRNDDGGKYRVLSDHAEAVAKVLGEFFNPPECPHFS